MWSGELRIPRTDKKTDAQKDTVTFLRSQREEDRPGIHTQTVWFQSLGSLSLCCLWTPTSVLINFVLLAASHPISPTTLWVCFPDMFVELNPWHSEFRASFSHSSPQWPSFSAVIRPPFLGTTFFPCQNYLSKKNLYCKCNSSSSHCSPSWDDKVFFKLAKSDGERMKI